MEAKTQIFAQYIKRFNVMGTLLLSCSMDKTIKVWDLHGNCIKTMTEHTRYVNCMAVNSDSTVFCSGSNDRTILIWDLTNTLSLDSHLTGVRSILFNLASSQTEVPLEFICPITHEIMKDPVIAEGMISTDYHAKRICHLTEMKATSFILTVFAHLMKKKISL